MPPVERHQAGRLGGNGSLEPELNLQIPATGASKSAPAAASGAVSHRDGRA